LLVLTFFVFVFPDIYSKLLGSTVEAQARIDREWQAGIRVWRLQGWAIVFTIVLVVVFRCFCFVFVAFFA
jgi:hypothetical protein